jgi:hypothetical protein
MQSECRYIPGCPVVWIALNDEEVVSVTKIRAMETFWRAGYPEPLPVASKRTASYA